jgi:phage gpG-like protein
MIRFSATVEGVEVLNRAFTRIDQQVDDLRSLWPATAQTIYGIFGRAFATEGASTAAGKWRALSPSYAKRKAIVYPGQPVLQAEGTLVESLTDPEANDAVFLPERNQLTIGSRTPYARRHQRTRPMIAFTENDKRDIQKSLQQGLVQFARGTGFIVGGGTA